MKYKVIKLKESKILTGQKVSVKLQFDNPNAFNVRSSSEMEEQDLKPFTYTYSEHGVVLAISDNPDAADILLTDSQEFIKSAWGSLRNIEFQHGTNDFIPLEPEMRTMRYNTYRNGYVRFEYGYALIYATGEDMKSMKDLFVGDEFGHVDGKPLYKVLNKTLIIPAIMKVTPIIDTIKLCVSEGIVFELEQINRTKEDK